MKKICAIVLAAVMLLSACTAGQPSSSGEEPKSSGQTSAETSGTETPSAGESTEAPQTEQAAQDGGIVIWVFAGEEERTRTVCERYIAKPQQAVPAPEGGWTVTVRTVKAEEAVSRLREAAAGSAEGADPAGEELPDIFFFSSDDLDVLKAGGLLDRLPEKRDAEVRRKVDETVVAACSSEGVLWAYPAGFVSTMLLYYDKTVVSETGDLASVISQCGEAERCFYAGTETALFPAAVFASFGLSYASTVLPDGRVSRAVCDYYTEKGLDAARALQSLMGMSAFRTAEGSPVLAFSSDQQERAGAVIADSSHTSELRGILGNDYGVAALPPVTYGENAYPFLSEGTYLMIGVTPDADESKLQYCHLLAQELTSSDAQRARYEANGTVPVRPSLLNGITSDDKTASALVEQMPHVLRRTAVTEGYRGAMDLFTAKLLAGGADMKTAKLQQLLDELSAFLMADVPKAQE